MPGDDAYSKPPATLIGYHHACPDMMHHTHVPETMAIQPSLSSSNITIICISAAAGQNDKMMRPRSTQARQQMDETKPRSARIVRVRVLMEPKHTVPYRPCTVPPPSLRVPSVSYEYHRSPCLVGSCPTPQDVPFLPPDRQRHRRPPPHVPLRPEPSLPHCSRCPSSGYPALL